MIDHIVTYLIAGLIATGLAWVCNKVLARDQGMSRLVAWPLTGVMFIAGFIGLSAVKVMRLEMMRQELGIKLSGQSEMDFIGGFIVAYVFFIGLNIRDKK